LIARGFTRFTLGVSVVMTALTLAGVLVFRPGTPQSAVWVWSVAQVAILPLVQYVTARLLGDNVISQIRAGLPSLALTAVAVAAAFLVPRELGEPASRALLIVERLAVGAAVYLPTALLLLRGSVVAALSTVGMRRRVA